MDSVRHLIVGAGVSGLAMAAALRDRDYLVLEADSEIGGYCKTVVREGFTWDYSGHFFHFKHPEIEAWLRARMAGQEVRTVHKKSFIRYGDRMIDFPFQKNIHQLPQDEFIDCLHDLYFARAGAPPAEDSFKAMLYARFGRAIAEKFLIPYNEKLYACDLGTLDRDAMGRFFPHANLDEIVRNMKVADNASYNTTFTYPAGGAIQYIRALASEVRDGSIALDEPLLSIDLPRRVARTPRREIRFERLISSAPFPRLAAAAGLPFDGGVFSWNKVLVFNLGFDRKGARDVHWVYVPDRAVSFYRIGYYDNIFDSDSPEPVRRARLSTRRRRRRGRGAGARPGRSAAPGDHRRSSPGGRAFGGHGPGLCAHHARLDRRAAPPVAHPAVERRLFHRPLRWLDVLLDRGQHRRGARAGRRLQRHRGPGVGSAQ